MNQNRPKGNQMFDIYMERSGSGFGGHWYVADVTMSCFLKTPILMPL
jgi:hypothetical protein